MKTTIVNHRGIIQNKFIIRNIDDLMEYEKVNANEHGQSLIEMCHANATENKYGEVEYKNNRHQLIHIMAQKNKTSHFVASYSLAQKKIMKMLDLIHANHVLVVNMAGGYTFWDDKVMSIVEDEVINQDDDKYFPIVNIIESPILLIENDMRIPDSIHAFIKNNFNQQTYSSISNLSRDYDKKIGYWLSQAIKKGCNTIIFETQLMNHVQIEQMCILFEELPPLTFYIFTTSNLKELLNDIIGQERTESIFDKHTININF